MLKELNKLPLMVNDDYRACSKMFLKYAHYRIPILGIINIIYAIHEMKKKLGNGTQTTDGPMSPTSFVQP